jgi:thioredoxin-dependent peroxiredoxin
MTPFAAGGPGAAQPRTTMQKATATSTKKAGRAQKVPARAGTTAAGAKAKKSAKKKPGASAKKKPRAGAKKKPRASAKKKSGAGAKKKTSAKKTSAKKTSAKKTSAKKPSAKKTSAKKTSAKKTSARAKPSAPVPKPAVRAAPSEARGQGRTRSHLQPGDPAPPFSLQADDGKTYRLEDFAGRRFVLYFYPKDATPGCTQEACDFRDRQAAFAGSDVQVLGVSADSLRSHGSFRAKYGLGFSLLSDPDRDVADAYGALGEKTMYGQTKIGIIRSTFVVGPDARIEHVFSPVRVAGHADAVLQAVRAD